MEIKKLIGLYGAMLMANVDDFFARERRTRIPEKKESQEDRARRERCEQMAIEKAKAKRERKAAKRRKDNE